ncbi:MAG: hypothetical protein ABIR67_09005, partial [Gaiellaceae bacterium]
LRLWGLLLVALALAIPASAQAHAEAGADMRRLDVPRELRVVSYFPADAGWTRMWEPWRPDRVAADLLRLRGLNANTVRIVLPAHFFGYPEPEQRYLHRLRELVGLAAGRGLHVQLTLFDWWGEYRDVEGSKRWARAVLEPYVGDARVAFVELRNEIDPANGEALAWARELVPWLRDLLGGQTPVTVSVAGMTPVRDLRALAAGLPGDARPDFFAAHYFTGSGELAQRVFSALRAAAAPTPLWLGELGYPTSTTVSGYPGVPLTPTAQEAAQAHYFKLCFTALARLGLPQPGLWILDDFAAGAIPDSDVHGREPEYRFGLFHEDGSAKPAAAAIRALFGGKRDMGFNGGFEAAAIAEDRTAVPALWMTSGGLRLVRDATGARSGSAAGLIAGTTGSGAFAVTPVTAAVRTGRAKVTAWVRGAAGTVRIGIGWFDQRSRQIGQNSARVRPEGRWRRVVVSAGPPVGAAFARVLVRAGGVQGAIWLDDVSFDWR